MLSDERLAEIEAREKVATKGPWEWDTYESDDDIGLPSGSMLLASCDVPGNAHHGLGHTVSECGWPVLRCDWPQESIDEGTSEPWPESSDANFIAHARQDIPDLLAEVRRLRERVKELEE